MVELATMSESSTTLIRRAGTNDAPLLTDFAARVFSDSFGAYASVENMARYLRKTFAVDIQRNELADPALTYLMAFRDSRGNAVPVGYALVREGAKPESVHGPDPIEVGRFYVDSTCHGSGLAQHLMAACAREARRRRGHTLWLQVWEQNGRAIRFYEKCGFRDVGRESFWVGSAIYADRVMALELGAFA